MIICQNDNDQEMFLKNIIKIFMQFISLYKYLKV